MLLLNVGVCGTVFLVALVFFIAFLRRQRRRLRQVEALLRDEEG